MTHTRKYLAKKLLANYRRSRKNHAPALARTHAYFCLNCLMAQTQWAKYNRRYWSK